MKARKKPEKGNLLSGPSPNEKKPVARRMDTKADAAENHSTHKRTAPAIILGAKEWTQKLNEPLGRGSNAEGVAENKRYRISQLFELAEKNSDDAVIEILRLAEDLIEGLDQLLETDSERFLGLMESRDTWPTLLPARAKQQRLQVEKLKALGFGCASESNPLGEYRDEAPITAYVIASLALLTKVRRTPRNVPLWGSIGSISLEHCVGPWLKWTRTNSKNIPARLTRQNAGVWAKLTSSLIEVFWGSRFEDHRDFAQYRKSKAYSEKKPAVLRGEIRRQWRTTWHSIANVNGLG